MLFKLMAVILALGLIGCALLVTRQQRLQAVHELAQVQKRVAEHDRRLWALRAEIASRVTPSRVKAMAQALGPLEHLPIAPMSSGMPATQVAMNEAARAASSAAAAAGNGARSGQAGGSRDAGGNREAGNPTQPRRRTSSAGGSGGGTGTGSGDSAQPARTTRPGTGGR